MDHTWEIEDWAVEYDKLRAVNAKLLEALEWAEQYILDRGDYHLEVTEALPKHLEKLAWVREAIEEAKK